MMATAFRITKEPSDAKLNPHWNTFPVGRPIGLWDRSIDNHVSNLRKKLGNQIDGVERIRNVRGSGYIYTGETGQVQR
jgi:hypothetical protein